MEFRILGPLEVAQRGRPLTFDGRKARVFLGALLLQANEVVATGRLTEELWGDRAPATAERLVQGYAHAVRKQLGEALVTRSRGYLLRVGEGELDLLEFERLRAQARELPGAPASELLGRALALWRGQALSDLELEGPLRHEVERLNELRLETVVERIEIDLALGRHGELVGELDALVAAHPLDERLRRQLMLALYGSGRQAEALAAYQCARRLLVDELGIEPSRELQSVEKAILIHDPTLSGTTQPARRTRLPGLSAGVTARTVERDDDPLQLADLGRETRKAVSVCFCDVTLSTALGERVDAEVVRRVMLRCFEVARVVIDRHGGAVEKFAADAVLAVFGVPVLHEDDALRAVRAASELCAALVTLNGELERDFGVRLEYRIGLSTGEVVTGADERLAIGDAVNVAARLGQAADAGEVLMGEETRSLVRDAVEVESVPPLVLKGMRDLVPVHRLVALRASAPGFSRRLDTAMVGRQNELDQLRRAYEQAVRDRACHLFTLLGSAGVGKSRLAAEFVTLTEDATVAGGRCLSYGDGITYTPVVEVLKQLLGDDRHQRLAELALDKTVRSAIAGLLDDEGGPISRGEIALAVRKLLEAVATLEPLVVVFDDLQWGEEAFLDLVEHIADWSRDAPVFLLCMARPELLESRATWGSGKRNASAALLEPLSAPETDVLIERLLGAERIDQETRSRIRQTAEGNPLFVEQMLALVAESSNGEVAVPPTIQALLAARLDQLDPAERTVLERGAVEGRVFHRGAISALAPEEQQLDTRLVALVRRDLVRPFRPQFSGEDAFRFRHELIRDAAYRALPKQARAELHRRLAAWLEQRSAELVERDELLGYHLEQAHCYRNELGMPGDRELTAAARRRVTAAGFKASGRADFAAAENLLTRAVRLADGELDVDLELELAHVLFYSGKTADALALTMSVGERAADGGQRIGELRARIVEAILLVNLEPEGAIERLEAVTAEALPLFEAAGDNVALLDAFDALVLTHSYPRDHDALLATAERALHNARTAGAAHREQALLQWLANARYYGTTPLDEFISWLNEQEAEGHHHPAFSAHRAETLACLGRFDESRATLAALSEEVHAPGATIPIAFTAAFSAAVEAVAGDYAAAEAFARDACAILDATGERGWLARTLTELAQYLYALGRVDEAEHAARQGGEIGASDDIVTQLVSLQVRAKALARHGDAAEAERLAREAVSLGARTDMLNLQAVAALDLAEVLELGGQPDAATDEVARALALFERKGNLVLANRARIKLNELRAGTPSAPRAAAGVPIR